MWPERGVSAVYDFTGEQYFSPIRSRRMPVRGTHGELAEDRVVTMREPGEPVVLRIARADTGLDGDLGGHHLRAIALGDAVLWRNPFGAARLSDDELAVATVLRAMRRYVTEGDEFYGIADAAEDQYLSELVHDAARTGQAVTSAGVHGRCGERAGKSERRCPACRHRSRVFTDSTHPPAMGPTGAARTPAPGTAEHAPQGSVPAEANSAPLASGSDRGHRSQPRLVT